MIMMQLNPKQVFWLALIVWFGHMILPAQGETEALKLGIRTRLIKQRIFTEHESSHGTSSPLYCGFCSVSPMYFVVLPKLVTARMPSGHTFEPYKFTSMYFNWEKPKRKIYFNLLINKFASIYKNSPSYGTNHSFATTEIADGVGPVGKPSNQSKNHSAE